MTAGITVKMNVFIQIAQIVLDSLLHGQVSTTGEKDLVVGASLSINHKKVAAKTARDS